MLCEMETGRRVRERKAFCTLAALFRFDDQWKGSTLLHNRIKLKSFLLDFVRNQHEIKRRFCCSFNVNLILTTAFFAFVLLFNALQCNLRTHRTALGFNCKQNQFGELEMTFDAHSIGERESLLYPVNADGISSFISEWPNEQDHRIKLCLDFIELNTSAMKCKSLHARQRLTDVLTNAEHKLIHCHGIQCRLMEKKCCLLHFHAKLYATGTCPKIQFLFSFNN